MSHLHEQPASRRRNLRRSVYLEAGLLSDCWDDEIALVATNLSPDGMWVQTALPLDQGDEVVVSLRPPRWRHAHPLVTLARVARVGLHRRCQDGDANGMGLAFVGMEGPEVRALAETLRGLPPPLPGLPDRTPPRLPVLAVEPQPGVVLRDGSWVAFEGAGALLTGGRGRHALHRTDRGLAPVVPLHPVPRAG